jgi:hypothetical protein
MIGQAGVRRRNPLGFIGLAAAVWLGIGCLAPVFGQIGIGLTLDRSQNHDKYLQYEPVWAEVTLRNNTGNSLVFDAASPDNSLDIQVETSDGLRLDPRNKANLAAGLILGPGESRTLKVMLNSIYNLNEAGSYKVTASISHARLSNRYYSEPRTLRVVKGECVWSKDFGMPAENAGAAIAERKVSILLFSDGRNDAYAVQVEDSKNVYGLTRIGPRFVGNKPQCDIDAFSNIHTLMLIRPRLVEYRVFDCNLKQKQRRYIAVDGDMPVLRRDPDIGRVQVIGGRPAIEGKDYQIEDVTPQAETPAAKPAVPPATPPPSAATPLPSAAGAAKVGTGENPKLPLAPGRPENPESK